MEKRFTAINIQIFFKKKDADIDKTLISNKSSSNDKNYKYFFVKFGDDYKIKLIHIITF